jgi:acid phosphatase
MEYLSKLLSKWMPEKAKVAVDSDPRLLGILDTTYATLAHGPATRLPSEFYDERAQEIIDKIGVEEWYSGFKENAEYRRVGIGALLGDTVARMVDCASKHRSKDPGNVGEDNVTQHPKLALNGCHDTTIGGILSSLGAFEGEKWPSYTSHIALELFQDCVEAAEESSITAQPRPDQAEAKFSWWSSLFPSRSMTNLKPTEGSGRGSLSLRTSMDGLSDQEKQRLENHYLRVRYNDRVMQLPGCGIPGNHRAGDPSMCTLVSRISPCELHGAY